MVPCPVRRKAIFILIWLIWSAKRQRFENWEAEKYSNPLLISPFVIRRVRGGPSAFSRRRGAPASDLPAPNRFHTLSNRANVFLTSRRIKTHHTLLSGTILQSFFTVSYLKKCPLRRTEQVLSIGYCPNISGGKILFWTFDVSTPNRRLEIVLQSSFETE